MIIRACRNPAKITLKLYTQLPCGTKLYVFDLRFHLSSMLYVRSESSDETADLSEPSLLAEAISTKILCAGPIVSHLFQATEQEIIFYVPLAL